VINMTRSLSNRRPDSGEPRAAIISALSHRERRGALTNINGPSRIFRDGNASNSLLLPSYLST